MRKSNIVFICTENSARSQMAEGFAKKLAPKRVGIFSAGTRPAQSLHSMAIQAMKDHQTDISRQRPKHISDLKNQRFDLAVTLCKTAQKDCPILAGSPSVVHWPIDDPGTFKGTDEEVQKEFARCAEKIKNLVSDLFSWGYFKAFVTHKNNMENILNSLSEGIIAHDLDRKIFFFSKNAAKLTGVSPVKAIGQDCHDLFEPRMCGANCSFCEGADISELHEKKYSTVFHNAEGERIECNVTVIPIMDEQDKIRGVMASIRDRTQLKSLERELGRKTSFAGIIGRDHKMMEVFQQIRDVALYDYPVQIYGETGTGKELVARAIHNESPRKNAPFVPINCGALPEGLIESELFGHVKGSFSGAIRDKKGRFELADGGTILLDEVAELPKHVQVKLLRFLQEGIVDKVGSEKHISVSVRVISATNKNLKQEVEKNNFREDLFYRLNVIPLSLPPLRDRKNDIPLLSEHFLQRAAKQYNQELRIISKEALSIMMAYHWPGNVRDLENAIQFAIIKSKGKTISPHDLPMELSSVISIDIDRRASTKLDIEAVKSVLKNTGGNKAKAAKRLGIGRATLYRFLKNNPEAVPDDL